MKKVLSISFCMIALVVITMWAPDASGTCIPTGVPETVCNGIDDDCDGLIDENYTPVPSTCGVGECAGNTGVEECQNGVIIDTCDPLAWATAEVCDNLDNDCDGATDEGGVCEPGAVDLDIVRFRVSNNVKLGDELKRLQLTVESPNGGGHDMRPATLTGVQNGMEVYNKTRMVFDLTGNGRSRFAFPPFTPTEAGTISWTVEIHDDDTDDDTATASTNVK